MSRPILYLEHAPGLGLEIRQLDQDCIYIWLYNPTNRNDVCLARVYASLADLTITLFKGTARIHAGTHTAFTLPSLDDIARIHEHWPSIPVEDFTPQEEPTHA